MKNNIKKKQKGAVLVMAPALVLAILTIMAVAIDLNYIYASKEQMQQFTKFVSLGAIEQFFATECNTCAVGQEGCTAPRTTSVCNSYKNVLINEKLKKTIPAYLLLNENIKLKSTAVFGNSNTFNTEDGIKTIYRQGRWITKQDQLESGQQCDPPATSLPCFKSEGLDYQGINAFKVETEFPFSLAARLTGPILGIINRPIKVTAVASVVPRRTCVLVDVSGSLTRETHLLYDEGSVVDRKPASEYAFYLTHDNPPTPNNLPPLIENWCTSNIPDVAPFHKAKWCGNRPSGIFDGISEIRPNGPADPKVHYKNDYIVKKTLTDADYKGDLTKYHPIPSHGYQTGGGVYRIDNFSDADAGYKGPEPLRTVFHGLKEMVDQFKERAVAGDKMCLIFYDNKLTWPRIVKLTDDFEYIESLVDYDKVAGLETTAENRDTILDNSEMDSGREKIIRHKLFPSENSYSDTYGALQEALRQLSVANEEGILTSDSIVHIGDGLANCPMLDPRKSVYTGNDSVNGFCTQTPQPPSTTLRLTAPCADTVSYYFCAMSMLKALVEKFIVPKAIPIHVIQVGQDVGPNTADVPDPDPTKTGKCLQTEAEIRRSGLTLNYVMGMNDNGTPWITPPTASNPYYPTTDHIDIYNNKSAAAPFYQATRDMFEIALMTKGIWAPIRPKVAGCTPPPPYAEICSLPPERRLTDPRCRDTSQQIKDYMSEIMNQNPFTVVDAE